MRVFCGGGDGRGEQGAQCAGQEKLQEVTVHAGSFAWR